MLKHWYYRPDCEKIRSFAFDSIDEVYKTFVKTKSKLTPILVNRDEITNKNFQVQDDLTAFYEENQKFTKCENSETPRLGNF